MHPKTEPAAAESSSQKLRSEPGNETGYNGEKERTSFGGQKMEFIHLLDMLVQTAMMYAGAMETGTERRVDIVGLRQMIDLIARAGRKDQGQPDRAGTGDSDQHDLPASDDVYGNREHDRSPGYAESPGAPGAPRK